MNRRSHVTDGAKEGICRELALEAARVGRQEAARLAVLRGQAEKEQGVDAPFPAMLRAQEQWTIWGVEELERRPDRPLRVVLMGRTQAGKSTLYCALTGASTDRIGDGAQATTRAVHTAPALELPHVDVHDTPGVGALDRPQDRRAALDAAREADIVLWVLTNDSFQTTEQLALDEVLIHGTPVVLVLNCLYDLSTPDQLPNFLEDVDDHPVHVVRRDEGHLVRPRNVFHSRGQTSATEIPVHALAYLWTLAEDHAELHPALRAASNMDTLLEALREEATRHRHTRRASAICDHLRALLSDTADLCEISASEEGVAAELEMKAAEEAQRLVSSVLESTQQQWRSTVDERLSCFAGWADRHYRDPITDSRRALQTDLEQAQRDLEERMVGTAAVLERRIARRLRDSARKWSELRVEASRASVPDSKLPGRLRGVAPDAVLAVLGLAAGLALSGWVMGAAFAAIGAAKMAGADRLLEHLFDAARRRRALQEHRKRLQSAVDEQVAALGQQARKHWSTQVDRPQRERLSRHCELLRERSRQRSSAAGRLRTHAAACRDSIASLDLSLVRALRSMEGDRDGASATHRVLRRPGEFIAVEVLDSESARREATHPHECLRNVTFVPASGACDDLRRVALLARPSAERPWRLRRRRHDVLLVAPREDLLPVARRVAEASTAFLGVPVEVAVRTENP